MKVVILNSDFRAYWKDRLMYLHSYLAENQVDFFAVELFGKGSPYNFDKVDDKQSWWSCLFPNDSAENLSKFNIKRNLAQVLDALQPDVIIGPSIVFYPGALGIAWAKKNEKKFIMFDDAKPSQIKRNFVVQGIKDLITSQADSLWLPSKKYDAEWGHFKRSGVNFFYGFNSIDNNLFNQKINYNPVSKNIICVARLVPVKNIDNMLRAWQLIEAQNTGYTLTIIGNGPEENDLKQLAAKLSLKQVVFLDAVDNKALPGYLKRSAAFVLPSLSETWGLVVNEAMAAALPVLLSDKINAADDLLKDQINGFKFMPNDLESIAGAISKFIGLSTAQKTSMSAASVNLIDDFSFEKMGVKLLAELHRLGKIPFKRPRLLSRALISAWYGRYNTAGWDKTDKGQKVIKTKELS